MKKIVMGVGMIVFVAALVAGGTGAFFSDVEESTGNVFTAGALDLTVDSESHYNGSICMLDLQTEDPDDYTWQGGDEYPVGLPCTGTWSLTDLENGVHTFFDFDDVKPGDEGENTISLHINNNPAWACVDVTLTSNDDNTSTEPELEVDVEDIDGDLFDGELAQNVNFAAWLDQGTTPGWQGEGDQGEGDNIWQGDEAEPLLFSNESGPASDVLGGVSYPLADSENGAGPIVPNQTNYIGLAWCAGTQDVDTDANTITCDGSTLGNIVQTDSFVADIAFRVEQHRNNEDFLCNPREEEPETGSITIDKFIGFSDPDLSDVDVSDFTFTLSGPGGDIIVLDEVENSGLEAGTYTISEVYTGDEVDLQIDAIFSGACSETGEFEGEIELGEGEDLTCTITNNLSFGD